MQQRGISKRATTEELSAPPDPTKELALTNQAGVDVVVLVPTLTNTPDANGIQVWNQNLELLKSITGSLVVANGATGTFVLEQYFKDPKTGQQVYSTVYDLLVSTANWYVPVANVGVIQNFLDDPPSYPAQTVSQTDAAALARAGVFYQTISAYPTSALAKSFQQAMSNANDSASSAADGSPGSSANVANTVSQQANAFFQGTKSFQNVTLAGLVAIENYYNAFPFVWAGFGSDTYWLYSSDGKTTSFVGTIALSPPKTLDLTQANGGYTCVFTPASNPTDTTSVEVNTLLARPLSYADGLFVDSLTSDVPNVAVKGTFQIKRLFTQTPTDTQIIPVLTGTIDGAVCIGFDQPQKSNDKSGSAFWSSLFHPKNSAEIFKSIMTIGGAVMMLFFFGQIAYGIYKWARGLAAGKQPTTEELLKAQEESLGKLFQEKIDSAVAKLTNRAEQAPDSPDQAQQDLLDAQSSVADNQNAGRLTDALESQADSVQELAQFEPDMNQSQLVQLEEAGASIQQSHEALESAPQDQLGDVVAAQSQAVDTIGTNLTDLTTQLGQTITEQTQQRLSENATDVVEAQQDIADAAQNQAEDQGNEDPSGDDPIEPDGV